MKQLDIEVDPEQLLHEHFRDLHSGGGRSEIRGGQTVANSALAQLDITGYAKNRSEVLPVSRRGASGLSPYIRHNLLTLTRVWQHVGSAPYADREKYRDELLWQEYARHLYARIGTRLFDNLRFHQVRDPNGDGWPRGMSCVDSVVDELHQDGWLVNQTRMWLASQWTVRNSVGWIHGQEAMYRHLIDGSRAANLLGWQWTVGSGTGKPYGFARWQVEKRAPALCGTCALKDKCPIESFPDEQKLMNTEYDPLLVEDPDLVSTTGPVVPEINRSPNYVLLTVDSMGDDDPALVAHPEIPAAFVFNAPALQRLQLSSKRIYFYLETLIDLAERRDLKVFLGDPIDFAQENNVAVTFAPVPSFRKFRNLAEVHPFPWLRRPHSKSVRSFSAWRSKLR